MLDAHDLHALMERDPRIAERIKDVVRERVGRELVSPKGDIVTEEIEHRAARKSRTMRVSKQGTGTSAA